MVVSQFNQALSVSLRYGPPASFGPTIQLLREVLVPFFTTMNPSDGFLNDMLNQYLPDFFGNEFDQMQSENVADQPFDLLPEEIGLTSLDLFEYSPWLGAATDMQLVQSEEAIFDLNMSDSDPNLSAWLTESKARGLSQSETLPAMDLEAPTNDASLVNAAATCTTADSLYSPEEMPQLGTASSAPQMAAFDSFTSLETSQYVPRDSVSRSQYARLLPKPSATSQTALDVTQSQRKRPHSPSFRSEGIPTNFCHMFGIASMADKLSQPAGNTKKRRVAKTCLRCQVQNKGVDRYHEMLGELG